MTGSDIAQSTDADAAHTETLTLTDGGAVNEAQLAIALMQRRLLVVRGYPTRLDERLVHNGFTPAIDGEAGLGLMKRDRHPSEMIGLALQRYLGVQILGVSANRLEVALTRLLQPHEERMLLGAAAGSGLRVDALHFVPQDSLKTVSWLSGHHVVHRDALASEFEHVAALAAARARGARRSGLTQAPGRQLAVQLERLIKQLFRFAAQEGASDVHIVVAAHRKDKDRDLTRDEIANSYVALRVDGDLRYSFFLDPECARPLATRLQDLAHIDFADKQTPQDGRWQFEYLSRTIDARVATLPIEVGEGVTVRLLDSTRLPTLEQLFGDRPEILSRCAFFVRAPVKRGRILVLSGPVGTGKSTTQAALVRAAPRESRRVISVEQPVEFRIPLVHQVQVRTDEEYDRMLRAALRHDPDIFVMQELRNWVNAETAMRAAVIGHSVVFTVHADSAPHTVDRIVQMFPADAQIRDEQLVTLAHRLEGVINHRLLKTVCEACGIRVGLSGVHYPRTLVELGRRIGLEVDAPLRRAYRKGCAHCNNTGFRGRALLAEALFLPHALEADRDGILDCLRRRRFRELVKLPDVLYRSAADGLGHLLGRQLIDLGEAAGIIGSEEELVAASEHGRES